MGKYKIIEEMTGELRWCLLKITWIDKTLFLEGFSELRKSPEEEGEMI